MFPDGADEAETTSSSWTAPNPNANGSRSLVASSGAGGCAILLLVLLLLFCRVANTTITATKPSTTPVTTNAINAFLLRFLLRSTGDATTTMESSASSTTLAWIKLPLPRPFSSSPLLLLSSKVLTAAADFPLLLLRRGKVIAVACEASSALRLRSSSFSSWSAGICILSPCCCC